MQASCRGPEPLPAARSVVELILTQASRTPDALAVVGPDGTMTYAELDARSACMADALATAGIGGGDVVGVSLRRCGAIIATLLGVLRAGAAYLPPRPDLSGGQAAPWPPPSRCASSSMTMSRQPGCPPASHDWPAPTWGHPGPRGTDPPLRPEANDPAYVLFTSGTTGTPKAVVVRHAEIVNLLSWASRTFSAAELSRVLVGTSLNFDFSVLEIAPLAVGGCAVVIDSLLALRDPEVEISLLSTVPSVLDGLRQPCHAGQRPCDRLGRRDAHGGTVRAVARALATTAVDQYLRAHRGDCPLLCHRGGSLDGPPPIGEPIDGTLALVVDHFGRPLPAGVPGELRVGGRALTPVTGTMPSSPTGASWRPTFRAVGSAGLRTGDLVWADRSGVCTTSAGWTTS